MSAAKRNTAWRSKLMSQRATRPCLPGSQKKFLTLDILVNNCSAAKAGIMGFTRSVSREVIVRGVNVNAIAPGLVRTDFARALWEDEERVKQQNAKTPLGRLGEPDEIAGVAVMLASNAGSYVSGQTIAVDGGLTIATS